MAVGGREEKWMVLDHSTNPVAATTSRCEPFPGVCQKSDMIVFFMGGWKLSSRALLRTLSRSSSNPTKVLIVIIIIIVIAASADATGAEAVGTDAATTRRPLEWPRHSPRDSHGCERRPPPPGNPSQPGWYSAAARRERPPRLEGLNPLRPHSDTPRAPATQRRQSL